MSSGRTLSEKLCEQIAQLTVKDLPPKTVWATKKILLDAIGITLAGTKAQGCDGVVKLAKEIGGNPTCTILGYGIKGAPPMTAFSNATMAHAFEFDDTHDQASVHTGGVILSTALAIGELMNSSGEDLLLASALGLEVFCRLGLACQFGFYRNGYVYTPAMGLFASAITAAKLLGSSVEEMVNAIGIAYDEASGTVASSGEGVLSKRLLAGHAAQHGVFAALLANKGINGPREALDGKYGFYNVYIRGEYTPNKILDGLGKQFEIPNIGLKPYPSCRYTHGPIETMFEARSKGVRPEDVESIEIEMNEGMHYSCGQPAEVKSNPHTVVEAQFSIPYNAACALVQGYVFLDDFTPEAIKRPEILKVSNKIKCKVSNRVDGYGVWKIPGIITTIKSKNKPTLELRLAHPTDNPLNPISDEKRFEKFTKCAKYGVKSLTEDEYTEVIRLVNNLEKLSSVHELTGNHRLG